MTKIMQLTCAVALAVSAAWGQASGALSGRVTTVAGTGVPAAAITITEINSNSTHKVLTGQDGAFSVTGLPPGTYRIDVETAGFKRTSQRNVELSTTAPTTVNLTLEAGSVNETVEVMGTAPVVQTESAEVAMPLNTRAIRELPVIDRNHQQLIGLQTGITPPEPVYDPLRDPERNRLFSANGQSPFANLWQTDGVVNQEPFRGTAIRVQSAENMQQMSIVTGSHSTEKGFSGGAIVTDISRPGTNGWHGSVFEFHSNDELRSRPYFSAPNNPVPGFVYNQFGGAVGGSIVPDNFFVFGSYEGTYGRGATTEVTTVPVSGAQLGDFRAIPGVTLYNPLTGTIGGSNRTPFGNNTIPSGQINPTAAAIAGRLPAPNQPGFVNNYVSNVRYLNDANKYDGRLDYRFGERTAAFLRYGYSNRLVHQGSPLGDVIGSAARGRTVGQNALVSVAHSLSDSMIADFRFGYNRFTQKNRFGGDQSSLFDSLGFAGNNNMIGINIAGFAPIGAAPDLPMDGVDNTFNFVTNWSFHTSSHNFKWGLDVRRMRSDGFINPMFGPNGTAFFGPGVTMSPTGPGLAADSQFYNSYAAFLLGAPSQIGVQSFLTAPAIRQWQSAVWVGDTIRLMNRLTAELGVRYELYSPLEPRNEAGAQFYDPASNTFNYAGIGNTSMRAWRYDLNNIAPRVGLAFRVSNRTAIRAGYALSYFQIPYMYSGFSAPTAGSVAGVQGGFTVAPFAGQFSPIAVSTVPPSDLQNGAPAGNLPANFVTSRDLRTPYIHSYNLQVQQDFYYGTLLSVGYVGTLGRQLPYSYEANAALPGAGTLGLPFAPVGRTGSTMAFASGANTNYNSLQASLNKRFSHGLSFTTGYTWSKALGYTDSNGVLLNPFDWSANYGPMDYDRQHIFTLSHLWELPFGRNGGNVMETLLGGWQLNGMFTWQTGTPLTITANPLSCACPGNTVFASLNGDAAPFGRGTNFLIPAGFSAPAPGEFGNLGRGALRGPDTWNYDLSIFKSFRVQDRFNLELRGEAYNLTNTPHYTNPVTNINSAAFGQITRMRNNSFGRQLNVGARLVF